MIMNMTFQNMLILKILGGSTMRRKQIIAVWFRPILDVISFLTSRPELPTISTRYRLVLIIVFDLFWVFWVELYHTTLASMEQTG